VREVGVVSTMVKAITQALRLLKEW